MNIFISTKNLAKLSAIIAVTPGVVATTNTVNPIATSHSYVYSMNLNSSGAMLELNDESAVSRIKAIILKELGRNENIRVEFDEYQDEYFFIIPTKEDLFDKDYETMNRLDKILQNEQFRNKSITVMLGESNV